MTHEQYEVLSNQAVAACAVVYFLAVLAHLAQWAAGRTVEAPVARRPSAWARRPAASAPPRTAGAPTTSPSGWSCSAGSAWR